MEGFFCVLSPKTEEYEVPVTKANCFKNIKNIFLNECVPTQNSKKECSYHMNLKCKTSSPKVTYISNAKKET